MNPIKVWIRDMIWINESLNAFRYNLGKSKEKMIWNVYMVDLNMIQLKCTS